MLSSGSVFHPAYSTANTIVARVFSREPRKSPGRRANWHCLIGWSYAFGDTHSFSHIDVAVVRHSSGVALAFSKFKS